MLDLAYYSVIEPEGERYIAPFFGVFGVLMAIKPEKKLPSDVELQAMETLLRKGHALCYWGYVIRYIGGF